MYMAPPIPIHIILLLNTYWTIMTNHSMHTSQQGALPTQYVDMTSMDLVANLCSQLTLNDVDEETDNDMVTQAFNSTMV